MYHNKPFSQACENNQQPIAETLKKYVKHPGKLLEVGSGTGQHACYLSAKFPELQWQPTDREPNILGIKAWVKEASLNNIQMPILFDVNDMNMKDLDLGGEPFGSFDYFFTANTLHIMSWDTVNNLFSRLPELLNRSALLFIYGPFKYAEKFTSESNKAFDQHLKSGASHQGIRDIEAIQELASRKNISLLADHDLPANNQLLVWQFN